MHHILVKRPDVAEECTAYIFSVSELLQLGAEVMQGKNWAAYLTQFEGIKVLFTNSVVLITSLKSTLKFTITLQIPN